MSQGARCALKTLAGLLHPRQPLRQLRMSQVSQGGRELPPTGSLQDSVQSPGHYAVAWSVISGCSLWSKMSGPLLQV